MFNVCKKVEVEAVLVESVITEVELVNDVEVVLYEVYCENDVIVLNIIKLNVVLVNNIIVNVDVLNRISVQVPLDVTDVDVDVNIPVILQ